MSSPHCLGTNWACRGMLAPGKAPDLELLRLLGTPCIQAAGGHCPPHAPNPSCTCPSMRSWGCAALEENKLGGEGSAPHPALAWVSAPCPPSQAQHLPRRATLVRCPEQPLGVRLNPPFQVGHRDGPCPSTPCPSSSIKVGRTNPCLPRGARQSPAPEQGAPGPEKHSCCKDNRG